MISDETCEPNEVLAYITISTGEFPDAFSWQLFEVTKDEWENRFESLLAAGGEYDADEEISFELCLVYPGEYFFQSQSNSTDDSSASIEASIGGSGISVGLQDVHTFVLTQDGSLEITSQGTSPSPSSAFFESDFYATSFPTAAFYSVDGAAPGFSASYAYANCFYVDIYIETDFFGDETSWNIVNTISTVGAVVVSVPRGSYASNSTYNVIQCLDSDGCYSFTIYDQWSDGICCEAGTGVFNVSANGRFLYEGGDFKASDTVLIGGSCSSGIPENGICPSNESPINVTVRMDESSFETTWEVYDNTTGKIYFQNSHGNNTLQSTSKCIPQGCNAFAIYDSGGNGFNETSDAFFEVSYDGDIVASGAGNFGNEDVTYFGC